MIFKTYFFSECVTSRQTASFLSNHKSHCQLVPSLNSCATQAPTQADKQLFRWIKEHAHTCRDADAEMRMQTVMGLLTCFSLRAKSPALPPFLSNPLPSFSSSISPVTKGVFLFKGPQKPLGTQSENCYNWWRRGEAGRDRGLYCCRVQKDMAGKLLS